MNEPAMIETTTNAIHAQRCVVTDLQADLAFLDDGFLLAVTRALDDKGKPLFSNEALRVAAIREQQRNSEQYQQATLKLRLAQERLARLQAQQERMRLEFKLMIVERQERLVGLSE